MIFIFLSVFSQRLLNEYEIITRNSNTQESSDEENEHDDEDDDELGYAVARSVPFPIMRQRMDAVSASEPEFPKLFHRQEDSATSESLSVIQQPAVARSDPLDADWIANNRHDSDVQNVYRKVANWVFSQQRYFPRPDKDEDDIEVIDPIDLFHDSLLDDFILLTRSSSEKRILLREFASHSYNMLTVREASRSFRYDFLKNPMSETVMEMSDVACENEVEDVKTEKPFVAIETVLDEYVMCDREGCEVNLAQQPGFNSNDPESSSDEEMSVVGEEKTDGKGEKSNGLDVVSYNCSDVMQQNQNSDDCTSVTYPTDVFEITTAFVADLISESDENETDVWEDAKAVPHWLDSETEDHLFCQPHRPFYYYRDRIKGCYRIIGVEDETVVLFSGNDDDSIFYGCGNEERNPTDISALRRSHSLGLLNSSTNRPAENFLSKPLNENLTMLAGEKRNDSGIEDGEDSLLDVNLVETALSARECLELGRLTKVIRNKEHKTVKFSLEKTNSTIPEYLFVIFAFACLIASIIIYFISDSSTYTFMG